MKKEKVTLHDDGKGGKYLRRGGKFAGRTRNPIEEQASTAAKSKSFFSTKVTPPARAQKDSIEAASEIFKKLNLNGFDFSSDSKVLASEVSRWDASSAPMVTEARDSVKNGLDLAAIGIDTKVSVRDSLSSVGNYLSRVLGTPIPA